MSDKLIRLPGFGDWVQIHLIDEITINEQRVLFRASKWRVDLDCSQGDGFSAWFNTRAEAQNIADQIGKLVNASHRPDSVNSKTE